MTASQFQKGIVKPLKIVFDTERVFNQDLGEIYLDDYYYSRINNDIHHHGVCLACNISIMFELGEKVDDRWVFTHRQGEEWIRNLEKEYGQMTGTIDFMLWAAGTPWDPFGRGNGVGIELRERSGRD